jgi:CHRD domain-containing protein
MKRGIWLTSLALVVLVSARLAYATPITLIALLSGPNESPPNNSPGTGFAEVIVDPTANTLFVNVSFSGLTTGTTASHIHCCVTTPGTGTAIVATTTPTFPGFPSGVTSGTYTHTLDLTLASSYNPAFITANGGTPASAEAALIARVWWQTERI